MMTILRTAAAIALCLLPAFAAAQNRPEFIAFPGARRARSTGRVRTGTPCRHPRDAPHRELSQSSRLHGVSRRGFLMLCMNTRYENNEALVDFEKLPLDVKAGRRVPAPAARHHQGRAVRP